MLGQTGFPLFYSAISKIKMLWINATSTSANQQRFTFNYKAVSSLFRRKRRGTSPADAFSNVATFNIAAEGVALP